MPGIPKATVHQKHQAEFPGMAEPLPPICRNSAWSALPGTLVIGRDGKIVASIRGVIKPADLRKHLDHMLAQAEKQSKEQLAVVKEKPAKASSVPS